MTFIPGFAIVGASPAGYTFALSLLHHCKSIQPSDVLIIETNAAGRSPGGPFWLTPNSLRILDQFKFGANGESIYEQSRNRGYSDTRHTIRDDEGKFLGCMPLGNAQRWGYDALRIDRGIIVNLLEAEIQRLGIRVEHSTSLREVVREDAEGVEFVVRRGGHGSEHFETLHAKRLIGADGIHSRTRTFVAGKEIKPKFSGHFMADAYVARSALRYGTAFAASETNKEYGLSITGRLGTVMMIPNDPDARVMQAGRQWPSPDRTREEWEALAKDKRAIVELFTKDKDGWSVLARSVLDNITIENQAIVWPMYLLPKLERWISKEGRALIIGDSAHVVIPAAAQGANQAFEDAWTLAQAYAAAFETVDEIATLRKWEAQRIERLERVAQLSVQLMNVRLPPEEQAKLDPNDLFDLKGDIDEMEQRLDWLYGT